jgi:hypothetical protein
MTMRPEWKRGWKRISDWFAANPSLALSRDQHSRTFDMPAVQQEMFNLPAPTYRVPSEVRGEALVEGRHRWWLRRWWRSGPPILWCMLNPSLANATRDDPTMRRVIHFSNAWGFGGCIVVNLYPFITAKPKECRVWAPYWHVQGEGMRPELGRNKEIIEQAAIEADMHVVAWGAGVWDHQWAQVVTQTIRGCDDAGNDIRKLFCLGITGDGSPIHPMARGKNAVPHTQKPVEWIAP